MILVYTVVVFCMSSSLVPPTHDDAVVFAPPPRQNRPPPDPASIRRRLTRRCRRRHRGGGASYPPPRPASRAGHACAVVQRPTTRAICDPRSPSDVLKRFDLFRFLMDRSDRCAVRSALMSAIRRRFDRARGMTVGGATTEKPPFRTSWSNVVFHFFFIFFFGRQKTKNGPPVPLLCKA